MDKRLSNNKMEARNPFRQEAIREDSGLDQAGGSRSGKAVRTGDRVVPQGSRQTSCVMGCGVTGKKGSRMTTVFCLIFMGAGGVVAGRNKTFI